MVLDKIDDSMEALADRLRELSQRAILPDHVVALISSIVLDRMSYSYEFDDDALETFASQTSPEAAKVLEHDLAQLSTGQRMMICPGGDRRCGTDIIRNLPVSETVPEPFRRRIEAAKKAWIEAMDGIARDAGKEFGVPLVVRYDLTATGPELAFGYGREHGHHGAAPTATPLAEIE